MRIKAMKVAMVGFAVAAGAMLSACSGQDAAQETVNATPKNQAQQLHSNGGEAKGKSGKDVNCSANGGKVGPYKVDLIAVGTDSGVVGCTEAFNVITQYYEDANKVEGTGRHREVQGWRCSANTGPEGPGPVVCDKDGLSLHTTAVKSDRQSEGTGSGGVKVDKPTPSPKKPATTPTKPAGSPAEDINCSQLTGSKVGPAGGRQVDAIAVGNVNGNPGCDMTFNVLTEYFEKAPHGEGPGRRVLDIMGSWSCAKAAEPEGSQGVVFCGEGGPDGRAIQTAPAK